MLRKANRRMAVGAGLALVAASLVVLVPSAYAAFGQIAPTTGSVSTAASAGFHDQLMTSGGSGGVTFSVQASSPPGLIVTTSGAITTSGALSAGAYTLSGTATDSNTPTPDTTAYSYVLTVVAMSQIAPTTGSVSTAASAGFHDQLNTTGGIGSVTFSVQASSPPGLIVSTLGAITTTGSLRAGNYMLSGTATDSNTPTPDMASYVYSLSVAGGAITQVAPTSATVGTAGSVSFTDQLNTTGVPPVTFIPNPSSGITVSSSGRVTTTGALAPGTYSANGAISDALLNTGTYSFTLTVSTVPGAPSAVSASGGNNSASVHWSAPLSDGGSPIIGYVITPFTVAPSAPSTGAPVVVGPGTSATVGGLINGLHYEFTVAAMNVNGTGPPSALSTPVSPDSSGYWLVASDGGIFSFGSQQFYGSTGAERGEGGPVPLAFVAATVNS